MAQYRIDQVTLVSFCRAARRIGGTSGNLSLAQAYAVFNRSSVVDTADANATASTMLAGSSGYVNGTKVNGSMQLQSFRVGTSEPSNSLGDNGDLYLVVEG